jgi:hypothetical protein
MPRARAKKITDGVPAGWKLIKITRVKCGEYFIDQNGQPQLWIDPIPSVAFMAVIEKIEKPKKYRPFLTATEFIPHADKWVFCKSGLEANRVLQIYSKGVALAGRANMITWQMLFDGYYFGANEPCGKVE